MNYGTALLADSHLTMLDAIRSLLEDHFETVVMVADERSLIEAVERLNPEIAMVDVSFPLSGKTNVVAQLRSRFPALNVIALSLHDEVDVAERVIASGARGFVLKRTATTDLLPALRAVAEGGTFVSPAVGQHGHA